MFSHLYTPQHQGLEVLLDDLSPLQIPECKCWIWRGLLHRQSPRRWCNTRPRPKVIQRGSVSGCIICLLRIT